MNRKHLYGFLGLGCVLFLAAALQAEQAAKPAGGEPEAPRAVANDPGGLAPGLAVPRLVKFSGAFRDRLGRPLIGVYGVTFALYKDRQGGAPVWVETQSAEMDEQGRYTVLLGSTQSEGLPLELFTAGESRWLGVQVQLPGEEEKPRVLLVSVPYALKAADADTLGGKPVSAFLLAPPDAQQAASGAGSSGNSRGRVESLRVGGPRTADLSGSGTTDKVTKWLDGPNGILGDSAIWDLAGNVGIRRTPTTFPLEVSGIIAAYDGGYFANISPDGNTRSEYFATNGAVYGGSATNHPYIIRTSDRDRITVLAGGNVGIGRTPTTFPLEVSGIIAAYDGGYFANISPDGNTRSEYFAINGAVYGGSATNHPYIIRTSDLDRITVLAGGNVGIGTTGPGAKLEVAGNVLVSGGGVLTGNGSGLTNLNASNLTGAVANSQTTATSANTANAIVLRDGSGNFNAGTVTAGAFSGGGAALTGVNAATLGGVAAGNYARTDVGNTLSGNQQISGLVSVRNSTFEQLQADTSGNVVALGSLYVGTGNFVTASGGDLVVGQATNGSTISNVFRVDSTGKGFFNGGTTTGGADFAESFAVQGSAEQYEPGDVLVIDPTGQRRLALSQSPYSTLVAGIYSTKPGVLATPYSMDHPNLAKEVPLAMVGVVPCKVTAENGPIAIGDLLVTSSVPGHAMRGSDRPRMLGAVVGKALEPLPAGQGVIQVLVTLQ